MNKILKIFFYIILLSFTELTSFGQTGVQQTDSTKLEIEKTESKENLKDKNTQGAVNKQQGVNQKTNGINAIKRVNGSRPDMSKARGARPAYIERQAGSGIPKGIGRPGGAGRPGKR